MSPGVGTSAIFGPPMVVLSMYFNKRRALATGIAMTGGSVGTMIIPQVRIHCYTCTSNN